MFFVDDQMAAPTRYRDHVLRGGSIVEEVGYVYLDVDGFEVGFHPADSRPEFAGWIGRRLLRHERA